MARASLFSLVPALLAASSLGACSSGSNTPATETRPTLIEASPEEFLGGLACGDAPGALRRYVATLIDVTDEDSGAPAFALPSSAPVPCEQSVVFGWVVVGHFYAARIDGYDRDDIEPLQPGLPIMVQKDTREPVGPRWSTACGESLTAADAQLGYTLSGAGEAGASPLVTGPTPTPTECESYLTRRVRGCAPWVSGSSPSPTRVEIRVEGALDGRSCGSSPGAVERFSVRRGDAELGTANCGEPIALEGVAPGELVQVEVLAYGPGADQPSLGTTCTAVAVQGTTVSATCDPLATEGGIALEVTRAVNAAGAACDGTLASFDLTLETDPARTLHFESTDCGGTAQFSDLAPGSYDLRGKVAVLGGSAPVDLSCKVNVEPGLVALPTCQVASAATEP